MSQVRAQGSLLCACLAWMLGCSSDAVGGDAVDGSVVIGHAADSGTRVDAGTTDAPMTFGKVYEGGEFHLGPVDWDETQWHNACAPSTKYAPAIRQAEGELLAGVWNGISEVANLCDACIVVHTAMGKSATLRVVTYGDTSANSIDVSPAAYALLDSGEYPRAMTWQLASCPTGGPVHYEFQTGASEWWTSLWVRNARVPLAKIEVKSANHPDFVALERGGDGTLTDAAGFGAGPFSLRLTSLDGRELTADFAWPSGGLAGTTLVDAQNF
jgi:expansin